MRQETRVFLLSMSHPYTASPSCHLHTYILCKSTNPAYNHHLFFRSNCEEKVHPKARRGHIPSSLLLAPWVQHVYNEFVGFASQPSEDDNDVAASAGSGTARWRLQLPFNPRISPRFELGSPSLTLYNHSCTYVCMYVCCVRIVCVYVCIVCVCVCDQSVQTLSLALTNAVQSFLYICIVCMYVCMHACMHLSMYACMYVCISACMHVCIHAYMYACMHVCMHACMYVCVPVHRFTSDIWRLAVR
jgi:hypothetical protein